LIRRTDRNPGARWRAPGALMATGVVIEGDDLHSSGAVDGGGCAVVDDAL
jgi:hypothetical protein